MDRVIRVSKQSFDTKSSALTLLRVHNSIVLFGELHELGIRKRDSHSSLCSCGQNFVFIVIFLSRYFKGDLDHLSKGLLTLFRGRFLICH